MFHPSSNLFDAAPTSRQDQVYLKSQILGDCLHRQLTFPQECESDVQSTPEVNWLRRITMGNPISAHPSDGFGGGRVSCCCAPRVAPNAPLKLRMRASLTCWSHSHR